MSIDDPDFDAQFFPSPATSTSRHMRAANYDIDFNIEKSVIWDFFEKVGNGIKSVLLLILIEG